MPDLPVRAAIFPRTPAFHQGPTRRFGALTLGASGFYNKGFGRVSAGLAGMRTCAAAPASLLFPSRAQTPVVQEAIEKAELLIEAMGWIRRFRDKITVIKLGGSG